MSSRFPFKVEVDLNDQLGEAAAGLSVGCAGRWSMTASCFICAYGCVRRVDRRVCGREHCPYASENECADGCEDGCDLNRYGSVYAYAYADVGVSLS